MISIIITIVFYWNFGDPSFILFRGTLTSKGSEENVLALPDHVSALHVMFAGNIRHGSSLMTTFVKRVRDLACASTYWRQTCHNKAIPSTARHCQPNKLLKPVFLIGHSLEG